MDDRNNTILGWVLGAGIVALGLASLTGHIWKPHESETFGYAVAGAAPAGGGADAGPSIEELLATADPAKGQQVYAKCAACHTVNQGGANGIGPNLYAIMGDAIGHGRNGFAFSSALSGMEGNWDFANMNEWLQSPRRFAPGTTMSFAGLSSAEDRANLMAYLNAQGSNLPLPAVPAAEAPASDAPEAADSALAGAEAGGAADPTLADGTAPTAGAAPAGPAQAATKN